MIEAPVLNIREIDYSEYASLGDLMVRVYSELEGFPSPSEQPGYYKKLSKVGSLNEQDHTTVLVAEMLEKGVVGGVVYYDDMSIVWLRRDGNAGEDGLWNSPALC